MQREYNEGTETVSENLVPPSDRSICASPLQPPAPPQMCLPACCATTNITDAKKDGVLALPSRSQITPIDGINIDRCLPAGYDY